MSDEPITFQAQVARVATLADGGIRISLDAPESAILAAAQLMECKRFGVAGIVTFEPMAAKQETSGDETRDMAGRSEWQSQG